MIDDNKSLTEGYQFEKNKNAYYMLMISSLLYQRAKRKLSTVVRENNQDLMKFIISNQNSKARMIGDSLMKYLYHYMYKNYQDLDNALITFDPIEKSFKIVDKKEENGTVKYTVETIKKSDDSSFGIRRETKTVSVLSSNKILIDREISYEGENAIEYIHGKSKTKCIKDIRGYKLKELLEMASNLKLESIQLRTPNKPMVVQEVRREGESYSYETYLLSSKNITAIQKSSRILPEMLEAENEKALKDLMNSDIYQQLPEDVKTYFKHAYYQEENQNNRKKTKEYENQYWWLYKSIDKDIKDFVDILLTDKGTLDEMLEDNKNDNKEDDNSYHR